MQSMKHGDDWSRSRTSSQRRRPRIYLMAGRKMKGKQKQQEEVAESMNPNLLISNKYQPRYFQEIVGQNIVVKTLSIAVQKKKIAPLYLFHGPNGTGKTSTARLFAMALNCHSTTSIHNKPCYSCKGCSASLCTIDLCFQKIKTLVQNASFDHPGGFKKVFIIEDCHLLCLEAWVEVMSSLQGVCGSDLVFLLITHVDVNAIAGNISSRCHKFYFSKLNDDDVTKKLLKIVGNERMVIEKEALKLIVAKSQGSLREAENILDQLALSGPAISTSAVQQLVGLIPENELMDLVASAVSGDTIKTIRYMKKLSACVEPASFVSQLTSFITNLLSRDSPQSNLLSKTHLARLCYILKLLVETERQLRSSTDQIANLITAFLDITSGEASTSNNVFPRTQHSSSFSELTLHSSDEHQGIDAKRGSLSDMEQLWKDVLRGIESAHAQKFLRHRAKLVLLSISTTNAIIHLSFTRAADKLAAEVSQESLAKAFEVAIGCPVTLHMSLVPLTLSGAESHPFVYSQQRNTEVNSGESSQGLRLTKSKSYSTSQPRHRRYSSSDTTDPQTTNSIQAAGDSKTQTMRASKPRHRWLSLSSIPQSDASVEPYSQDVIYANFYKDGDAPKLQKGFSKSFKDRRFRETADQLQSNPSWYC